MADAVGRLFTLVAIDEDGLPRPVQIDADGNLLISNQAAAEGGGLIAPTGKLMTPIGIDPDGLPRPIRVDEDGYLKVAGGGSRVKIYDKTLTETSNFTITAIPQIYDNIEMVLVGRSDEADTVDTVEVFFNSDVNDENYFSARHNAGNTHTSIEVDGPRTTTVPGADATPGNCGVGFFTIPNYTGTVFEKGMRCWGGERQGGDSVRMFDAYVEWENDAAITWIRVKVKDGTGFIAGSRLIVHGTT